MEERWDIYDKNKQLTGRTMKRNDWTLKDDEYHLTVLGVIRRSCLLYTSPSPRDAHESRMPSSA